MTLQAAVVLLALTSGATPATAQQTKGLPPMPPPAVSPVPTPAPLVPPTSAAPAIAPPGGLSPLLTQPGPAYSTPQRMSPSYPAAPMPGPIDQQKMQSYRNDLLGQRWQLERQGVSPDSQRYREIQQQLNQLGSR
jgi:hypothetical protein